LTLLVGWQEWHPACKKTEWWGAGVVICLELSADLHTAQRMPLPLTVSCFSKIQVGFTFLVLAHLGSPGKRAVKRVCVCTMKSTRDYPDLLCMGKTALQISEKISLSHKLSQVLLALGDHLSEVMTKIVTIISGEPFFYSEYRKCSQPMLHTLPCGGLSKYLVQLYQGNCP